MFHYVIHHLDGWFVQVAKVGRCLTRFLPKHNGLRVYGAERINHHFALHTLNRINHHCYSSLVQSFKTLKKRTDVQQ